MRSTVLGNMEGQIVLAGDFNQVMDNMIDRSKCTSNSTPKDRLAILMLVEDTGLRDIWRLVHPNDRYIYFLLSLSKHTPE
jgi:exonuclease III